MERCGGPGARPAAPAAGGRAASSSCHSGEVRRAEGARGRGGLASERYAVWAGGAGRAAARAVCGRRLSGLERRGREGGRGWERRPRGASGRSGGPAGGVPGAVLGSCLGQRTRRFSELESGVSEVPCVPGRRRISRGH